MNLRRMTASTSPALSLHTQTLHMLMSYFPQLPTRLYAAGLAKPVWEVKNMLSKQAGRTAAVWAVGADSCSSVTPSTSPSFTWKTCEYVNFHCYPMMLHIFWHNLHIAQREPYYGMFISSDADCAIFTYCLLNLRLYAIRLWRNKHTCYQTTCYCVIKWPQGRDNGKSKQIMLVRLWNSIQESFLWYNYIFTAVIGDQTTSL